MAAQTKGDAVEVDVAAPIRLGEFRRHGSQLQLEGRRFGRLTVVAYVGVRRGKSRWLCRCDCGKACTVIGASLTSGNTASCGCAARATARTANLVHGHSGGPRSKTYKLWQAMWGRCRYPSQDAYKHYGGRGIKVCQRWRSFRLFLKDMGERPAGMYLGRRDPNGDYEPGNCKWATRGELMRNKTTARLLTLNDVTKCLTEWAEDIGIDQASLSERLKRGWPLEKALTTPKRGR